MSLPTRLHITGLAVAAIRTGVPCPPGTYYRLAVGAIRTSVPCPPDYTLQACGWLGLSGQVFPAHQTTHYRLAVGWSYQEKCSLPTRLNITALRLGGAIRTSVPCPPDYTLQACGWVELSGQVFPAHQAKHYSLAVGWGYQDKCFLPTRLNITALRLVGAIRTSVPCPPG